ncbi:MAG: alpha/beta fold hydrolase [Dehalococcoidia bacterium]|nr:alpha/beta fold hydrolase [Dehalococcoidia bacterium]
MPFVERDGVRIFYEAAGEGPPVLLSHGYSATSRMWRGQVEALAPRYRIITWDMRGHGQSDSPDDPALYSEAATVGDMAAILDALGIDTAVIGGLSLGGYMSPSGPEAWPASSVCPRATIPCSAGNGSAAMSCRAANGRISP